ncbi:MAG: endonuclease/exonuclease/phosphatase family protein [Acidobacteriota bacterium]
MIDRILEGRYASRMDDTNPPTEIKVLNWNIERGQRLGKVKEFMRSQQPDICVLQEVDYRAVRTERKHIADVLASDLQFNYVFGVEFEELSQGFDSDPAFTGQAVLARWEMTGPRILRFSRQSNIWRPRWYLPPWPWFQPRRGGRMALVVELAFGCNRLVVYDLHLESQEEDNLRLWQLSEVVDDSLRYPPDTPVVVAGDLNTRFDPSPLAGYLVGAGFQDACEGFNCPATKPNGKTLDWVFTRGPVTCSGTKVHRDTKASDHYPLSTNLKLTLNTATG